MFLTVLLFALPALAQPIVKTGVEVLLSERTEVVAGKRVGLITNRSAVDSKGTSIVDRLWADKRVKLVALYAPEHGLRADRQGDIADGKDTVTGLPVYSLYGPTKKPTPDMLEGIEVLVFDIQDVGARFYTYSSTMALAMQAAKEAKIPFVVLDRPNPIDGEAMEGFLLEPAHASFVGYYPIPVRHGMTMGELAKLFNAEYGIGCQLTVVPVSGWKRAMGWDETGLPWFKPSPAMKTPLTATLYPGICYFEATNVDCRVGDRPFERVAAPWLDGPALAKALETYALPGLRVTAHPDGVELHVTDRKAFKPVLTGLAMIAEIRRLHPQKLRVEPKGFDRMAGNSAVRERLWKGEDPRAIARDWKPQLHRFAELRKPYLLY